jgi:hypothetical protein
VKRVKTRAVPDVLLVDACPERDHDSVMYDVDRPHDDCPSSIVDLPQSHSAQEECMAPPSLSPREKYLDPFWVVSEKIPCT